MTKVIFLIDKVADNFTGKDEVESLGVFAYFPEIVHNFNGYRPDNITCYSHIGQHSACHPEYAKECKEANYNQYADLLKELISIGYNLNILNEQETEYHRPPTKGEIKFGEGATHYRTFRLAELLKPNGDIKQRFKANDGLFYSRR
jgi:hypothetical protein